MYSTDNKIAASYQVDLVVEFHSQTYTEKKCSIFLEITAEDFVWNENEFVRDVAPKFVQEEARTHYQLLDDLNAPEVEPIYAVCVEQRKSDEENEWFEELPEIEDEKDPIKKVTIDVDMGNSEEIFHYDSYKRIFTMKEHTGKRSD